MVLCEIKSVLVSACSWADGTRASPRMHPIACIYEYVCCCVGCFVFFVFILVLYVLLIFDFMKRTNTKRCQRMAHMYSCTLARYICIQVQCALRFLQNASWFLLLLLLCGRWQCVYMPHLNCMLFVCPINTVGSRASFSASDFDFQAFAIACRGNRNRKDAYNSLARSFPTQVSPHSNSSHFVFNSHSLSGDGDISEAFRYMDYFKMVRTKCKMNVQRRISKYTRFHSRCTSFPRKSCVCWMLRCRNIANSANFRKYLTFYSTRASVCVHSSAACFYLSDAMLHAKCIPASH